MTDSADDMFEETTEVPSGRKARVPSKALLEKLAESAKRGVAFHKTDAPEAIDDLRKDLASAAVRAAYEVVTGTAQLEDGKHRLTFAAKHKPKPPAGK